MSTSDLMSLPVDIPWKRLGTSRDMIDRIAGDRIYPPKWRSSLAVFYYEPTSEEQKFPDRIITYVKVSCSITGFQAGGQSAEVTMPPAQLMRDWERKVWDNYSQKVLSYYPCYGAIIQVAVFPRGNGDQKFGVDKYPFIMDFEPKKREMYESASEAKGSLSQSRATMAVKKGTTTTDYSEHSFSANVSGGYGGSSGGVSGSLSYGYKSGTKTETVDMVTADHSREQRENYSYTTSISHMYHLLNAYHLGTNRAVFFLQPRPHILDDEFTFVNGPRRLEGIQEFFLIIERPIDVPGFCVEATLETAHLEMKTAWIPRVIPVTDLSQNEYYTKTSKSLGLSEADKGDIGRQLERIVYGWWADKKSLFANPSGTVDADSAYIRDNGRVCLARGWNNLGIDERGQLNKFNTDGDYSKATSMGGTYWHFLNSKVTKKDDATEWAKENPWFLVGLASWVYGYNEKVGSLMAEVVYERVQQYTGRLFLTGRTTTNCSTPGGAIYTPKGTVDFLTYEKKIDLPGAVSDIHSGNKIRAAAANQAVDIIGREMIESLTSPNRLPYGKIEVTEAAFIQDAMADALAEMPEEDPYNTPLEEMDALDPDARSRLHEVFGITRRKDAVGISLYQIRSAMGLSEEDARRIRGRLLGDGPPARGSQAGIIVPQVVGRSLESARDILGKNRLTMDDDVTHQDGMEPRDTVINQYPDAGTAIERRHAVKLVVSSGPVTVPDVVGLPVDKATTLLQELPLKIERTRISSKSQPAEHVLESTPGAGAIVARNSQIVLLVSAGADSGSQTVVSRRRKTR
jgi:hypothetical protein